MSGHNAHAQLYDGDGSIVDPGNAGTISVDVSPAIVNLKTTTAETRTLANPLKEGKTLILGFDTDGGDCVVTAAAAINQTGNTIMTLADTGDVIVLTSIKVGTTYRWRVVANDGVALS